MHDPEKSTWRGGSSFKLDKTKEFFTVLLAYSMMTTDINSVIYRHPYYICIINDIIHL
jgi:hypothetical protein